MRRGFSVIAIVLVLGGFLAGALPAHAAEVERAHEPTWWFGAAGAANFNFYEGTTQQLNPGVTTLTPFHKGFGTGLYLAPVLEYRPGPVWGGILQLGYDDRQGDFDDVTCPCGESGLSAKPAYLSIEPSLRVAPFAGDLYFFAGPRVGFLVPWGDPKAFRYDRQGAPATQQDFSRMRSVVFSGQIGLGYDFNWAPEDSRSRTQLSPFASYQPRFGENPRSNGSLIDRWGVSTVRVGLALKFGRAPEKAQPVAPLPRIGFSVQAPATVVVSRKFQEALPLRNYVFFAEGSTELAGPDDRYVLLTRAQAESFREEQLQDSFPARPTGRSVRQIAVYHNLLNIIGDRLRRNPGSTITLRGQSAQGPEHGKARAETIKRYLTEVFGIDGARIATEGREPAPFAPGQRTAEELDMLRAENQRVEILSYSPEMLVQIGEGRHFMLKPVQIRGELPGTDSVVFTVPGAEKLASWSLEIADLNDTAAPPRRFGPYARDRETIPAPVLLGEHSEGRYTATLIGQVAQAAPRAQEGQAAVKAAQAPGAAPTIRKQASFALSRRNQGIQQTTRFAILFDIDQASAVSSYDRFLAEVVAPRIPDSGTVVIRGRTDVVGETDHNFRLSQGRADGVQRSLDVAAWKNGRRGVRYQSSWTGEDPRQAPFGNATPEERCYNRTVIIDILPE